MRMREAVQMLYDVIRVSSGNLGDSPAAQTSCLGGDRMCHTTNIGALNTHAS